MAVFVEARTDPFEAVRSQEANRARTQARDFSSVRRPTRGYEIKEDSYAMLRVVLSDGSFLPVLDSGGMIMGPSGSNRASTCNYSNFLVQSVVEQRQEKQQIVETFGDTYIFFYGESPRITQVSGFLLNSKDFNWRAEWWENYERYFRGTRLVENGARIYFIYDDLIIEGYMLTAQTVDETAQHPLLQLQFTMFVTGYTNISNIASPEFPRPLGEIDYGSPTSYDRALAAAQERDRATNQRQLTGDAVRRASELSYFGDRTLLTGALREGLISDPAISGFLARSQGALLGYVTQQLPADVPITPNELERWGRGELAKLRNRRALVTSQPLRGMIRDNTDEFMGPETLTEEELAAPLNMAERWLAMDRNVDGMMGNLGLDEADRRFYDLLGRGGRSMAEQGQKSGPRLGGSGVSFGPARSLAPSSIRQIPFGLIAQR